MIKLKCDKCSEEFSLFDKKCPNCGDEVKLNAKFYCAECGKKIDIYKRKCDKCGKVPEKITIKFEDGNEIVTEFDSEEDLTVEDIKPNEDRTLLFIVASALLVIIVLLVSIGMFVASINQWKLNRPMDSDDYKVFAKQLSDIAFKARYYWDTGYVECNNINSKDVDDETYFIEINTRKDKTIASKNTSILLKGETYMSPWNRYIKGYLKIIVSENNENLYYMRLSDNEIGLDSEVNIENFDSATMVDRGARYPTPENGTLCEVIKKK